MRPLVIANIEKIEGVEFLVAQLIGDDGYLLDTVIKRHESADVSVEYVKEIGETYGFTTLEMWTSDRDLYLASLDIIGIGASIKHPSDTRDTHKVAEEFNMLLAEVDTESEKSRLPRWKEYIIGILKNITKKLEGN